MESPVLKRSVVWPVRRFLLMIRDGRETPSTLYSATNNVPSVVIMINAFLKYNVKWVGIYHVYGGEGFLIYSEIL